MTEVVHTNDIVLRDVYQTPNYYHILYDLLSERKAYESISHEEMPTFFQHQVFVDSRPYRSWHFITNPHSKDYTDIIGTVAVTRQNEVAIAIFKKHRRKRWATKAIVALLEMYPKIEFLANINPTNQKSIDLFGRLGFKHVQNTYKIKR